MEKYTMTTATLTYTDFSDEDSSMQFRVIDMSAIDWTNARQAIDNMATVIDALSEGTPRRQSILDETIGFNGANPTLPTAQREIKALVTYADTVDSKRYSMTIPVFNYDGVVANTDIIDVTLGAWPAFVTALPMNVLSPNGNPVAFIQAILVGRSI